MNGSIPQILVFGHSFVRRLRVRHVLKPETTGTKPPEQPERNHRNDRNKNRKRPKPPKPKSNTEFHLLDLPRPYY
jgi:hypothetical protein